MSPIIIALDFSNPEEALAFAKKLSQYQPRFKVGKELFTIGGPSLVKSLVNQGSEVFLDLKFHDIPNTVARACQAAAELGIWMLNVHALGGREMLLAAREALNQYPSPPLLIAVSILTSLNSDDLYTMGLHGSLEENVLRLARLAHRCGLDGLVCSPHEVPLVRQTVGTQFKLVTPGIRLANSNQDDQKRVMTPIEALKMGANYLVIGRPITAAPDPLQAFLEIDQMIKAFQAKIVSESHLMI